MEFNTLDLNITLIIIIITAVLSIGGFTNQKVMDDLIFYPPAISKRNQWYRFITCGFIHADVVHLVFNMYAFYTFGRVIERYFEDARLFGDKGQLMYILLYFSSLVVCLLPTYFKNRDNYYYKSLGASGAVAAVVFAFIMLAPTSSLRFFFIPIDIPAFIFAALYLVISAYLDRRGGGNINHSAHFWGSMYGVIFMVGAGYLLTDYPILENFAGHIRAWVNSF